MPVEGLLCAVTGSTGYVGSRLVPRLRARGHRVRALARDPAKLDAVPWADDVEVVAADLTESESLTAAFSGVDVLYYLVHSMGTSSNFGAEERHSVDNVVKAAVRARVRRLVYLGGLHPADESLSHHLKSRTAVGDALLKSGVETIALQAGVVVGSGSASFEMIRHLTDVLPLMTAPKWVHNRIQPIAISDVLHYLLEAADAPVPCSRSWDVGGPDVLEYGDVMRQYAGIAGLTQRRILTVPLLTPALASIWVGLVTPIPSGLARPLVESLQSDAVMRNQDVDSIIARPDGGLTSYHRAVELALDRLPRGTADPSWRTEDDAASELLPTDPRWAGPLTYTDERATITDVGREALWAAVARQPDTGCRRLRFPLAASLRHVEWMLVDTVPGRFVRLRVRAKVPGDAWLEMSVTGTESGAGSRYVQRAVFIPRGLAGRLYWHLLRPLHVLLLRALLRDVVSPTRFAIWRRRSE